MRFLGIGEFSSLGDLYLRLQAAGHEVRVHVSAPEARGILAGMVDRTPDWRAELDWIRAAGDEGVIVFESAAMGKLQDELRAGGFGVIGGSAFGDRLENDRAFGQQVMRDAGMQTAPVFEFHSFDDALRFLDERPGRYVYKVNDTNADSTRNYVGKLADGADVRALVQLERRRCAGRREPAFVLMAFLDGVEVGVGGYFNGEEFLQPALLDWEHKHFFPGDLGELTGEMGTVVTYRDAQRIFDETLGRVAPQLRAGGYCGYINLNTIVNARGIWPLEFTCRFGYPGFAICDALHAEGWDTIFSKMLSRRGGAIATHPGFSVGVVVTVPPFPYEYGYERLSKGAPVFFDAMTDEERRRIHLGEVGMEDGQLVTSGSLGYVMVVTGRGATVAAARDEAYGLVNRVVVPNMRYRNDIGERFLRRDQEMLQRLGYLTPPR